MFSLALIAQENEAVKKLHNELLERGFNCSITADSKQSLEEFAERTPDMVVIVMEGLPGSSDRWDLPARIKKETSLPVIALITQKALANIDNGYNAGNFVTSAWESNIDDFITEPWDIGELVTRIKRVLRPTSDVAQADMIKCGALIINMVKCEVLLTGRVIPLTFKEYELLRFLASNPGKVFRREALLNKVWGYDYFGGDRTVDVHIRRLRSKIEDATHNFIETVRNIGYRFRENP